MTSAECTKCKKLFSREAKECPFCGEPNVCTSSNNPKKWYQKTSVSLSIAAVLIIIGLGFIHIVTGVKTPMGLPVDFALKNSFGFRETFVNARKIASIPYVTAMIKYPLGCEVLRRLGYIDPSDVFDVAMKDALLLRFKNWQSEFRTSINNSQTDWHSYLLGETRNVDGGSGDAQSYNTRGIRAANNYEYETALSEFARAISRDPVFVDAHFNRALVYAALGQWKNAIADFSKVIEIRPQFAESYMSRGQIYLSVNLYEEAISDFSKVIELDAERAEAYFSRALANFAIGEYDATWEDVHTIEESGYTVPREFIDILRTVSNRHI